MFIYKRDKKTGKDTVFTVDAFLSDIIVVFGDNTKHKQLTALAALVDGRFCQNLRVAYYIPEAISSFAREKLASESK